MTIRVMPSECLLRSYLLTVFTNLRVIELQQTRPWVATQGGSQFTRLKRFNKWLILNSYNHTSVSLPQAAAMALSVAVR